MTNKCKLHEIIKEHKSKGLQHCPSTEGVPCPTCRKHECPREKSLNDNVVCGGVKGVEGKQVCNDKTEIKK